MSRLINYFVYLFVIIIVIVFGFIQLNNEREIFAESMAVCCDEGLCEDNNCYSTSTMHLTLNNCSPEYTLDCAWCIYHFKQGNLCVDSLYSANPYCWEDGRKYYGTYYPHSAK